jgi:glycerol-3-phosphate dehydrogenase
VQPWTAARPSLDGQRFDVVVIGGGINGVAIARECARAGKRTLILEQHDFSSGTTSRSTRIIHGGLRYLEHGDIGLVRESLRERERLLRERPHLVRSNKFVLAIEPSRGRSALVIRTGLWLYRKIAGVRRPDPSTSARLRRQLETLLDSGRQWAIFDYDDAQCAFPERLVAEWLKVACDAGAVARNHTEALEITIEAGCVSGVVARDRLDRSEWRVSAETVINASGPWADSVAALANVTTSTPMIGGVRGSHIVLPVTSGSPQNPVYAEALDGRPMFFIPWNAQLLVGTTEVADPSDPARTQPSPTEIDYLLASANRLFPALRAGIADIRFSFAGVRPLPFCKGEKPGTITRRHIIVDHRSDGASGLYSIVGGKLTTAASLARECARKIGLDADSSVLEPVAAPPADGVCATVQQWARQAARDFGLPEPSMYAIAEWHGRSALTIVRAAASDPLLATPLCPHSPHLVAEAVHAIAGESAVTLADVLLRRVPVALGACWSDECSRVAAKRIAAAFRWTAQQTESQLDAFEQERSSFLLKPDQIAASGAAVRSAGAEHPA